MNPLLTLSIHNFADDVDALHAEFAAGYNLSVIGMIVLHQLYREDGQLASVLARSVGRAATSFTPILDRLQNAGFIDRKPHPDDRRAVQIFLTEKGKSLRKEINAHMDASERKITLELYTRLGRPSVKSGFWEILFAPLPKPEKQSV